MIIVIDIGYLALAQMSLLFDKLAFGHIKIQIIQDVVGVREIDTLISDFRIKV